MSADDQHPDNETPEEESPSRPRSVLGETIHRGIKQPIEERAFGAGTRLMGGVSGAAITGALASGGGAKEGIVAAAGALIGSDIAHHEATELTQGNEGEEEDPDRPGFVDRVRARAGGDLAVTAGKASAGPVGAGLAGWATTGRASDGILAFLGGLAGWHYGSRGSEHMVDTYHEVQEERASDSDFQEAQRQPKLPLQYRVFETKSGQERLLNGLSDEAREELLAKQDAKRKDDPRGVKRLTSKLTETTVLTHAKFFGSAAGTVVTAAATDASPAEALAAGAAGYGAAKGGGKAAKAIRERVEARRTEKGKDGESGWLGQILQRKGDKLQERAERDARKWER